MNSPAQVGMTGLAPTVLIKPIEPVNPERVKYEKLWGSVRGYREVSPGEGWSKSFLEQARPPIDAEVIDFGCGTGRGGMALGLFGAMKVTLLDFTDNCLDEFVAQACVSQPGRIKFAVQDLTKAIPHNAAYGYCCDVMEHIPPEDVSKVLTNILSSAHHVFFAISTVDDVMGAAIGEPLHLTVQPMAWWLEQLIKLGAVVHWSREVEGACAIYCSVWKDANEIVKLGNVNTADEQLDAQIRTNIEAGWINVTPYGRQNREIVLLAGGPTMADHIDEIVRLRAEGCALVTVNGAYQWAIDAGLKPSMQILLDAREFNARFTKPVIPDCRYLIASQAHPKALEGLPYERTYLWHSGISESIEKLLQERVGYYFPVPGGSTVVLRAIPLLRMLGFSRMHIFGFDSCVKTNGDHHAYSQPENDREPVIPVTCGGRAFECTPWMVSQASEFRDLVKFMGDEIELAVYGDGLIAQIIKTGASFSEKE